MAEQSALKAAAARAAIDLVRDGMLVGLGTGTTAAIFVDLLGERVRAGLRVTGVPTSRATATRATAAGIPLVEAIDRRIDIAFDGADEIDPGLNLLKGRGGALVREKLVAVASERFVVLADSSKLVERLGAGAIPVEVVPFLWHETAGRLSALGLECELRGGRSAPFVSDNGNYVVDCRAARRLDDPAGLATAIKAVAGVVDHGIFTGLVTAAYVGAEGGVRVIESQEPGPQSRHPDPPL